MIVKAIREGLGRIIVFINYVTKPAKMIRSQAGQERVNKEAKSLALYQYYACPFCVLTRRAIEKLNLPIEYRDAQNNPQYRKELLTEGGELQVPCLRIQENSQAKERSSGFCSPFGIGSPQSQRRGSTAEKDSPDPKGAIPKGLQKPVTTCVTSGTCTAVRWMYESSDIIEYLNKRFGAKS